MDADYWTLNWHLNNWRRYRNLGDERLNLRGNLGGGVKPTLKTD